jgi:hypothetical protein
MKTIRVSMDDDDFYKLHEKAKKSGLNSSALYLLSQAGFSANDSTKAVTFVRKALKRAKKQPLNESFKVKDLFSAAEWKGLSTGVRLRIGKQFREDVLSGKHKLKLVRKNSANHQLYERTG